MTYTAWVAIGAVIACCLLGVIVHVRDARRTGLWDPVAWALGYLFVGCLAVGYILGVLVPGELGD